MITERIPRWFGPCLVLLVNLIRLSTDVGVYVWLLDLVFSARVFQALTTRRIWLRSAIAVKFDPAIHTRSLCRNGARTNARYAQCTPLSLTSFDVRTFTVRVTVRDRSICEYMRSISLRDSKCADVNACQQASVALRVRLPDENIEFLMW